MAAFVRYNVFATDLCNGVHNFGSHAIKVALTNAAPNVATNALLGDIGEITAANGYSAGGNATTITQVNASGQVAIKGTDVVFTAVTGSMAAFRYAVLYNSTPSSPLKPLIGYWDYGSSVTLAVGESMTIDTNGDATNTILTVG